MIICGEGFLSHPYLANFEPRIAELEKEGLLIHRKREIFPGYIRTENGTVRGLILILEKPAKCYCKELSK